MLNDDPSNAFNFQQHSLIALFLSTDRWTVQEYLVADTFSSKGSPSVLLVNECHSSHYPATWGDYIWEYKQNEKGSKCWIMTHQMLLTQQSFLFALLTNHRCTRPTQIITMT